MLESPWYAVILAIYVLQEPAVSLPLHPQLPLWLRWSLPPAAFLLHQWEGRHFKMTAVYAPGEPGFSVQMTFSQEDEYGPDVRSISTCWPADVTAAAMAALDDALGLRPLAVRGT